MQPVDQQVEPAQRHSVRSINIAKRIAVLDPTTDVMTFAQGLRALGVSRSHAYKLMGDPSADFIRPFKVGTRWRYRRSDIDAYLERKACEANGSPPDPAQLAVAMSAVVALLEGTQA